MTYRTQAEKGADAPAPVYELRCERCNIGVPRSDDPRCPQCLRRTTVIDPNALTQSEAELDRIRVDRPIVASVNRVVWPYNQTCPVCGDRDVDGSTVFLRVAKVASGAGTTTATIFVSVRACSPCRASVVRFETVRYASAAALMVGMILMLGFFVSDVNGTPIGILGTLLTIGSLAIFTRRKRVLRKVLDESGLTAQVAELVPSPSGVFEHQTSSLHADLPDRVVAIDLLDAVRQARRREL